MARIYPPRRVQLTPGLLDASSAALDAEAQRSGQSVSTLIRLALERVNSGPLPRITYRPLAPGLLTQRVTSISHHTRDRIEATRKLNRLPGQADVIRALVEEVYPGDLPVMAESVSD